MIIRILFTMALLGTGAFSLFAQELTISPYSRYAIGDILSATTTRNAAMGGISVASDNYFSINRVNPASYGDIYFTTMDVSAFWQASQLSTSQSTGTRYTAGIQNAAFAFPSNNNIVLTMGFSPYSSVGYEITDRSPLIVGDSSYTQENTYSASGGLNQAFVGAAIRLFQRKLRVGVNAQYNFGNTQYTWRSIVYRRDSLLAPEFFPLSTLQDVYVNGWIGTLGFIYEDTLSLAKRTTFRVGGMVDYTLGMDGDRFTQVSNGIVGDTLGGLELGNVVVPPRFGLGFMVNRFAHWSIGADVKYQDWSKFQYFNENSDLGKDIRVSLGAEITPDVESPNYLKRIDYRVGGYYNQTYLRFDGKPVTDYGVTLGIGLPADAKGNSRFNRGRTVSRINISAELGRKGNLASDLPLQELYARVRIGATINDRWFIRRVVD